MCMWWVLLPKDKDFFMLSDAHEKKYQMFGFRSQITEESLDVKHAIWEMYLLRSLFFTCVIWFNLRNTNIRLNSRTKAEGYCRISEEHENGNRGFDLNLGETSEMSHIRRSGGMGSPHVSFRSTERMQSSSLTAEGLQPDPCTHTGKTTTCLNRKCSAGSWK